MNEEKILKIKKSVEELRQMYKDDPRQKTLNVLILGELGSGKSYLIRTARRPVHIDSFDPGGTKSIEDFIKRGEIVADTRWENEDPEHPSVYEKWKGVFDERIKSGYFELFGTYYLDSSTTWAETMMNHILSLVGLAGKPPRFTKDYNPQKAEIRNKVWKMINLPCDFFMTGHLEGFKDDVSGAVTYRFLTTGKGTITIPILFDEVWVMDPIGTSAGVEYRILTRATGRHLARSRLAKGGLLDTYEKPDLKAILKKALMPTEDKPKI